MLSDRAGGVDPDGCELPHQEEAKDMVQVGAREDNSGYRGVP